MQYYGGAEMAVGLRTVRANTIGLAGAFGEEQYGFITTLGREEAAARTTADTLERLETDPTRPMMERMAQAASQQ